MYVSIEDQDNVQGESHNGGFYYIVRVHWGADQLPTVYARTKNIPAAEQRAAEAAKQLNCPVANELKTEV